jgi:hypothetical protein
MRADGGTFIDLPSPLRFIASAPWIRGETIALIAEPRAEASDVRAEPRKALTTSIPTLDRILGPLEAGRITLIDSGSDFVFHLTTLLVVRAVMDGADVVYVDGGNSVDPHGMVALGKRVGLTRAEILPRVHVARAFTCHQMTTLLLDMLDKKLEETGAGLVVLSCLPEMYLDEDVERDEAHALFRRSMRAIQDIVRRHGVACLATNAGLAKLYRRKTIRRQLYESADRAVRLAQGPRGVLIARLDLGTSEWYRPVPPDQATLDDFASREPRIMALGLADPPKEVRSAGYLRFSW